MLKMLNNIVAILPLALVFLLETASLARGQCLSDNDDLSFATNTDLNAIQDFNIDLFRRLVPHDSSTNLIVSPYSIWNALVLAYFGSAGETQEQFRKVLRVEDKISALRKWRQLEMLYAIRDDMTINNTFVLSNRAYFDTSVRLRYCMEVILHNEIEQIDFQKDPERCAIVINNFVNETTRGHISQMVTAGDIQRAFMVLVNAAYFKGAWSSPFKPEFTRPWTFKTFSSEVQVSMMYQQGFFGYAYNSDDMYQVVEIPYAGNNIVMNIFLPDENDELLFDAILSGLNSTVVSDILDKMKHQRLQIRVPRFSIQTTIEEKLVQALYAMGLENAFFGYKSNFIDFSFNPNVKLDHSIHKSFINVNEEGTEAGAATVFIANKFGGTTDFSCDRPFIFAIRDKTTRNFLFMGVLRNPKPLDEAVSTTTPKQTKMEIFQSKSSPDYFVKG